MDCTEELQSCSLSPKDTTGLRQFRKAGCFGPSPTVCIYCCCWICRMPLDLVSNNHFALMSSAATLLANVDICVVGANTFLIPLQSVQSNSWKCRGRSTKKTGTQTARSMWMRINHTGNYTTSCATWYMEPAKSGLPKPQTLVEVAPQMQPRNESHWVRGEEVATQAPTKTTGTVKDRHKDCHHGTYPPRCHPRLHVPKLQRHKQV